MVQYTAVHYPLKAISNPEFIRVGLLLWDQIEYLAPSSSYLPTVPRSEVQWAFEQDDKTKMLVDEAKELLMIRRIPTSDEEAAAHARAITLLDAQLPGLFDVVNAYEANLHMHLPPGFMEHTCRRFERAGLMVDDFVTFHDDDGEHEVLEYMASRNVAYILMAMLAEECAGDTKRTVTDEPVAFASLSRYITGLHQGEYGTDRDDVDRLVAVSIPTFDVRDLELEKLVALRRQEAKGDGFLRQLRRSYLSAVDRHVQHLASQTLSPSDRQELLRIFHQETKDEIKELQRRLRVEASQALLSKDILVGVLAAAGILIEPVVSSVVTVGSLLKTAVSYRETRRKAMRDNAMSWLYMSGAR